MNHQKLLQQIVGMPLVLLVLVGCGPPPVPAVSGTLGPWRDSTPIAGRRIVLCQVIEEGGGGCVLMESAVTSDDQGRFEVYDVPPGEYFILYDSGLSDFDEAMERWGGQTFRWFDDEWLDEYFGLYVEGQWAELHIPEGVSPGSDRIFAYCQFALLIGDSPFVLAHVLGQAFQDERILEPVMVEVTEGQTSQVEFQVVYFGDQ